MKFAMLFRTDLRRKNRRLSFAVFLDAKATSRRLAFRILRMRRPCQAKWSPTAQARGAEF
jgi:hypothetical protein